MSLLFEYSAFQVARQIGEVRTSIWTAETEVESSTSKGYDCRDFWKKSSATVDFCAGSTRLLNLQPIAKTRFSVAMKAASSACMKHSVRDAYEGCSERLTSVSFSRCAMSLSTHSASYFRVNAGL